MPETNKTEKKSGKSFLDKVKGAIFETTETDENSSETVSAPVINDNSNSKFVYSNVSPATGTSNIPGVIPSMNGQFDEQFYQGFLQTMEKNNIEGIDYLEFSRGKKAMDAIPGMAEAIKYQSTYAQLQANSPGKKIEKDYLLKTADFYIEKLNEDEAEFNIEMQREINAEVNARNQQVQDKAEAIKKKQEQIAALSNEINTLNAEIGQTQNDAQLAQAKIDATAKNFKVTLEVVKNQINLDKQNIQNFIQ